MRHQGFNQAIAKSRNPQPVIEIQNYAIAGAGIARVVIDVTHSSESRNCPEMVMTALRSKLNNKMEAIAGSFRSIEDSAYTQRLTGVIGIAGTAKQIIAVNGPESMKGFTSFSSNMFMDEEKSMWVLRKTASGRLLVKSTGIDDDASLASILESCSASTATRGQSAVGNMIAQASAMASAVEAGDYVSFVDIDNIISHGFVVASVQDTDDIVVLPSTALSSEHYEVIKRPAVTEIHDTSEFPEIEETAEDKADTVVAAARNGIDLEYLLNFYKKIYARSPVFFAQFAARVKKHQFA